MLNSRQQNLGFFASSALILDAAGNVPLPRNSGECLWSGLISSGELQRRFDLLQDLRKMPLIDKVSMAKERIMEWYEAFGGQVAVAYSGGKDSSVLLDLVRSVYPDIPGVFANTGLEYPEVVKLVKQTENIVIVRPKMPFNQVLQKYGYPLISKKVARGISVLRHPTEKNANISRLYTSGVNRFGEPVNGFKVPDKWRFLVDAPFDVSDKCCSVMKKEPMHRYCKESGRVMYVGTLATDSKVREKTYLRLGGCNAFDAKTPRSTPLGPWTEQDVLRYVLDRQVPIASVYGEIKHLGDGTLRCSGVQRTGCVFCGFGVHMEGRPNRFEQLQVSHPSLYRFCLDKLGLGDVLAYIRAHCPDKKTADCFSVDSETSRRQMNLWDEL